MINQCSADNEAWDCSLRWYWSEKGRREVEEIAITTSLSSKILEVVTGALSFAVKHRYRNSWGKPQSYRSSCIVVIMKRTAVRHAQLILLYYLPTLKVSQGLNFGYHRQFSETPNLSLTLICCWIGIQTVWTPPAWLLAATIIEPERAQRHNRTCPYTMPSRKGVADANAKKKLNGYMYM